MKNNWIEKEIVEVITSVKRHLPLSWTWVPSIEMKWISNVRAALNKEAARGVRVLHSDEHSYRLR